MRVKRILTDYSSENNADSLRSFILFKAGIRAIGALINQMILKEKILLTVSLECMPLACLAMPPDSFRSPSC